MKRLAMLGLVMFLLCGFLLPSYAAQNQLDGDWVGEFKIDGKTVYVRTRFETKAGNKAATFEMPLEKPRRIALQQLKVDSSNIHFELPKEPVSLLFDGQLTNGTLSGEIKRGAARGLRNSLKIQGEGQLAEQHRIIAKVEELLALCDQLEAQLTDTQTESRRLLEAVLHEALAPAA